MRPGDVALMVCAAATLAACSGGSSASSVAKGDEARSDAGLVTVPVPPARPLGLASVDAFGYRRGPGRADYDRAVTAEKNARGDADWQTVVDACRAALAADPEHLDAAWLAAAALARMGHHDEILAPLSQAVAGDWGKWGERSLTLPLFGDFLASPSGTAWKQLAEEYRAGFAAASRQALVVLGRDGAPRGPELDRRAEVYGWDPGGRRWLRLSRTGGTVVAVLPAPDGGQVAYVAYRELLRAGDRKAALGKPRVGVIDLATGRVSRELPFDDVTELRLAWKSGAEPTLVADVKGAKGAKHGGVWILDWKREHAKRPAAGQKLTVGKDAVVAARGVVRRLRLPVAEITADWDDDGLASAIRLEATRKTVTPPAGLVVDGHGLVWSPDRARLALVTMPDGDCAAESTLFVVDAGTGKLRELGRAAAPAPTWVDATHLAYTAGDRVRLIDVTTGKVDGELTSSGGVATAIVARSCAAPSDEALFAPGPGDVDDAVDPTDPVDDPGAAGAAGVTPTPVDLDAGVSNVAPPGEAPPPADPPK